MRESMVRTWNIYVSSADTIESLEDQVAANELALKGVNQEALVGTRTTVDVLDAEQELVLSQVNLINARRDGLVAAYQLIATTGRLTAPNLCLCLPVPSYDSDIHYLRVRERGANFPRANRLSIRVRLIVRGLLISSRGSCGRFGR